MDPPTLLALASMLTNRINDFPTSHFPTLHRGVDSNAFTDLGQPFDFVVVGSGFAGSFLARQLASFKCMRVLLLEAGGTPTFDSAVPFTQLGDMDAFSWQHLSVPQKRAAKAMVDRKVKLNSGKTLGGDSVLHDGTFMPPNLADFQRWAYLYGLEGWNYKDMKEVTFKMPLDQNKKSGDDPFEVFNMTRSEILASLRRGVAPNLMNPLKFAWLRSAESLNVSLVSGTDDSIFKAGGFFIPKSMTQQGMKMNAASQFLQKKPPNLSIITHAEVQKLLYSPDGRRVIGLEFLDTLADKKYHANVLREVVLTAGAIGSAQVLLQSGIGPGELLRSQKVELVRDLPVGKRLNDRVTAHMFVRMHPQFVEGLRKQLNDPNQLHQFLINGTGALANSSVTGCGLFRSGILADPDVMLEIKPIGVLGLHDEMRQTDNYDEEMLQRVDVYGDTFTSGCLKVSMTVMRPFSQGTMWIWKKFDDTFQPRMNPSYLTDSRDVEAIVKASQFVEKLVQSKYMGAIGAEILYPTFADCPKPVLPVTDEYWQCVTEYMTTTGNHLTSTVPLGQVVDSRLRVFGMAGIRVADQSIFPEPASGGVASTTLTVANKAFKMITEDHRLRCS